MTAFAIACSCNIHGYGYECRLDNRRDRIERKTAARPFREHRKTV
jgi:hypothetical protein